MAREIPRSEWTEFLTEVTVSNEGRKAKVEVDGRCLGDAEGEDAFVLTGVEAGVQAEDEDTIVVALADIEGEQQGRVTHRIEDVTALRLREQDGMTEGLEIQTREGANAVILLGEEMPAMA
jgi:hypothetical protein